MTWFSQQISGEGGKIFRIATQEMVGPWWDPASGIHSFILPNMKSQVKCGNTVRSDEGRLLRHDGLCGNLKGPREVEVHTTGPVKEVACHRGLL